MRFMRKMNFLIVLLLLQLAAVPAVAEKRVALIVGNGDYSNVQRLANPPRDAEDIAAALQRLGYEVTLLIDANLGQMRKAVSQFGEVAGNSETAVFFYAGHGIEAHGENWLIPTDAAIDTDNDARERAMSLKVVLQEVNKAQSLGLVILDACRDNPFEIRAPAVSGAKSDEQRKGHQTRSVGKGLAPTEPTGNVLIAFSARDGTVAADGIGRNSPFTSALLHHMESAGLEITFLFRRVRDDVMAATNGEQQPFVYGSLSRDAIYLRPPSPSQLLAGMPIPSLPDSRPANSLFKRADQAVVDKIVDLKQFVAPAFQIDEIGDNIPLELKRFVGIWVSKGGMGGRGRQILFVGSHVDSGGVVSGYQVIGPPQSISWDQTPAGFIPVKGKIQDRIVKFALKQRRIGSLKLGSNNTMVITVQDAYGREVSTTLFPVWSLVLREQGDVGVVDPTSFLEPNDGITGITPPSPGALSRHRKNVSLIGSDNSRSVGEGSELPSREPRADTMHRGQVVLVNDGSCPAGQIKRLTAGKKGVAGSRKRECITR
jgi:Caspase domain